MSNVTKLPTDNRGGDLAPNKAQAFKTIGEALDRISFGSIQLTVHNGKLVQIDVTERHRDFA